MYMYMQNPPSVLHVVLLFIHVQYMYITCTFSLTGSYNGRSKPVYHSLLNGSSSGSCTDYCQFTSSSSLALQITTPLTPPNASSLESFQRYIEGGMTGSDLNEVSFSITDRRVPMHCTLLTASCARTWLHSVTCAVHRHLTFTCSQNGIVLYMYSACLFLSLLLAN